jgi:hypothetical protein
MAQLGVFLIPPAEHPFYALCTDILGHDIWARRRTASSLIPHLDAETTSRWLGEAPIFGIHCTIAGAALSYDDADIDEIKARLAWIASRSAPFHLVNGQIMEEFRANPYVLLAGFDSPDGAIYRLHRQVATIVSPLCTGSRFASRVPQFSEREREIYGRTGEPCALELFDPHWSLLTSLPGAEARTTVREIVTGPLGLFADDRTRTLEIADVHLVRREEDGDFSVAASFPLTGAE